MNTLEKIIIQLENKEMSTSDIEIWKTVLRNISEDWQKDVLNFITSTPEAISFLHESISNKLKAVDGDDVSSFDSTLKRDISFIDNM